ncbi:MAG: flagellar basal-body rod protein FlgG [Chthoniobacter sp.]|jgi:flagellar basal-body rod protein FlgG|nr:flagellar basal-body rod protein FlgG [Chthoniobacter sp.]
MLLSLYSGATGMQAQQLNLNTISNNLANVNTTGFKRSKVEFQDLMYQKPRAVGTEAGGGEVVPTGVEMGNGSRVVATAKIFTEGQLNQTGEKFDVAIQGDGFFEVQRPDGTTAYTRDGALKVSADGKIMTSDGLPLLSNFQPITAGATDVSIASTGEVTVVSPGGNQSFRVQLSRFNNPSGLRSIGGNLYEETPASGTPGQGNPGENGFGTLNQGYLEGSNVNVVEEMVNMITAQRAYEINSKSIQTSDEMLQRIAQLKQ